MFCTPKIKYWTRWSLSISSYFSFTTVSSKNSDSKILFFTMFMFSIDWVWCFIVYPGFWYTFTAPLRVKVNDKSGKIIRVTKSTSVLHFSPLCQHNSTQRAGWSSFNSWPNFTFVNYVFMCFLVFRITSLTNNIINNHCSFGIFFLGYFRTVAKIVLISIFIAKTHLVYVACLHVLP